MADKREPGVFFHAVNFILDGTLGVMSDAEIGAYVTLVMKAVGGSVDPDPERIRRVLKLTRRQFAPFWAHAGHLFYVRKGVLWPKNTDAIHIGWKGRGPASRLLRRLVAFWGNACVYCGDVHAPLEVEHIIPRARGGTDDITNLTVACQPCNNAKLTQTAAEFGYPHIHEQAKGVQ